MLRKLIRKPVTAAIMRAGKPGWDRPDVPINERYEIKRRIKIQARAYWLMDSMQPEYLLTNPEVLLYEWKDRKFFILMMLYVLGIYVATYVVLRMTCYEGHMHSQSYNFRSRINAYIDSTISERLIAKAHQNHPTGLNISPQQVGSMAPNTQVKEYLQNANNCTSHIRKINRQIRDNVMKIVQQAKHHAAHSTSAEAHSAEKHVHH